MQVRNAVVAFAGMLALLTLWLNWPGAYSIVAISIFLFSLAWSFQVAAIASLIVSTFHIIQTSDLLTSLLLATVLFFTAWLGSELGVRIRAIERRQKLLQQDLEIVLRAADRAGQFHDPEELLRRLPELLSDPKLRTVCIVEVGSEERVISGECDLKRLPLRPRAVLRNKYYKYYQLKNNNILFIPMCNKYVIIIESTTIFDEDERSLVHAFTDVVCLMRRRLTENVEARHFSRLMEAMASSANLQIALEKVLQLLLPMIDVSSGEVLIFRQGRFEPLAIAGEVPETKKKIILSQMTAGKGGIWQSYITYRPLFISDYSKYNSRIKEAYESGIRSLAFVPVSGERRARIILVVQDVKVRQWTEEERDFLALVARGLGLMAEQFLVRERLDALLRLEREVTGLIIEEAYKTLMQYAVRLVPGAEAGSLLVRNEAGSFSYAAALGYELESLQKVSYTLADMRDGWYNSGRDKWEKGEPRIVSASGRDIARISHKTAPAEIIDRAGRIQEIKANLCFPIVYQGEVLALMNLDSFSDPEAFDEESVAVSRIFAQQTALLLHEQHYRRLLEKAARTDTLTGLPNRRAFDEDYDLLWKSALRYGYPLAILILDLSGFKEINDKYGHAAGDQVLREVALVLSELVRNGDRVYRWGGDEFAVLLSHTSLSGAIQAARRYAAVVEKVCINGRCVHANVGAAAYPEDAADKEELLVLADSRMYQAKASGLGFEPRV